MSIADKALIMSTNKTQIDENMSKVYGAGFDNGHLAGKELGEEIGYEKGYTKGNADGYDIGLAKGIQTGWEDGYGSGYEAGKDAERKAFWDNYQENGNRWNYDHAFRGIGWTSDNWRPKYNIIPSQADCLFTNSSIPDINGVIEELGIEFDTSKSISVGSMFFGSKVTHAPCIDLSSTSSMQNLFYAAYSVISIKKIVMHEKITNTKDAFWQCSNLQELVIEGIIPISIDVHWSGKLSHDSIISIITHLSTTTSGFTVTFSKIAVNNAFSINVDDATTYPEGSEWHELRNSRSNWTFSFL